MSQDVSEKESFLEPFRSLNLLYGCRGEDDDQYGHDKNELDSRIQLHGHVICGHGQAMSEMMS